MIPSGFKPVDQIELHDTGVSIEPLDGDDGGSGWREFKGYEGHSYAISGDDICSIAQIFGVNPSPIEEKTAKGIQLIDPRYIEIKLMKRRHEAGTKTDSDYGGMDRIKRLWAKVVAPQFLEIIIEFFYQDDDDGDIHYLKNVTYSGNFTVWWKNEPNEISS